MAYRRSTCATGRYVTCFEMFTSPRPAPMNWVVSEYSPELTAQPDDGEEVSADTPPEAIEQLKTIQVKDFQTRVFENALDHHTDQYEICGPHKDEAGEQQPMQLVARRGQVIKLVLELSRPYNSDTDLLWLDLEYESKHFKALVSKGTKYTLNITKGIKSRHWSLGIKKQDGAKLELSLLTPPDAILGKWRLNVESQLKEDVTNNHKKTEVKRYTHPHPLYLICNPWCKDDEVYMEDHNLREEYVENDTGKIFTGSHKQIGFKPWSFGQFEDVVLDCVMYLLDESGLYAPARNKVINILRKMTAMVNAPGDGGVLVGNWSGTYTGGTAPTHWLGSAPILEQYYKDKTPVKYGQCWVFSGVLTTVCRALGIPTRSVTNFSSAHDCDGSITIDYHMDLEGNPIDDQNGDSVWNFHVWNESWVARPDLPSGFGGWQALDATPQETSDDVYCCGPCSVTAIKQGYVQLPYDGHFIFAEVNADRIYWIQKKDREWRKTFKKNSVGRRISTKKPDNLPAPNRPWDRARLAVDYPDREDITDNYKFKEGSSEERTAVYRANSFSSSPGLYGENNDDVTFEVNQKDEVMVGNAFDVVLRCQNKSRKQRSISGTITLMSTYYTGIPKAKVKSFKFDLQLGPIKGEDAVMRVASEEYLHLVVDQVAFKIAVLATVKETDQVFACDEVYRLRRPDLELEAPESVAVGEPFKVTVKFANSMPVHLTQCEWMLEGPGIQKALRKTDRNMDPYDRATWEVELTAKRPGRKQIQASFTSKELMDVTGSCFVQTTRSSDDN